MRFSFLFVLLLFISGLSLVSASGGQPVFSVGSIIISESERIVELRLQRIGGADGTLRVIFQSSDDTAVQNLDYNPMQSVVLWGDGDSSDKVVSLPLIINDSVLEIDESFWVRIISAEWSDDDSSLIFEERQSVGITIIDDDALSGSAGEISLDCGQGRFFSVNERDDQFEITVCRKNGTLGDVSVSIVFGDVVNSQRAMLGTDFHAETQQLLFRSGETEKTLRITPIDDEFPESMEYSSIYLSKVDGGASLSQVIAVLRIVSNDAPAIVTDQHIEMLKGQSLVRPITLSPPVDGLLVRSQIQEGDINGLIVAVEGSEISYIALKLGNYRLRLWVEIAQGQSQFVDVVVSVSEPASQDGIVSSSHLSKNMFDVSKRESAEFVVDQVNDSLVQITIYDRLGREVSELFHGHLSKGIHVVKWNGLDSGGHYVFAGAYTALIRHYGGTTRVRVVVLD